MNNFGLRIADSAIVSPCSAEPFPLVTACLETGTAKCPDCDLLDGHTTKADFVPQKQINRAVRVSAQGGRVEVSLSADAAAALSAVVGDEYPLLRDALVHVLGALFVPTAALLADIEVAW